MVGYASDETEDDMALPRAEAVQVDKGNVDVGAADQGITFGYASGEMRDEMPLPQQAVCTSARMFSTSVRATKASCSARE